MSDPTDIWIEKIRRARPDTQEGWCKLAVQRAIATIGEVDARDIAPAAKGIARGLFGPAYECGSEDQRSTWDAMCEAAYRSAIVKT